MDMPKKNLPASNRSCNIYQYVLRTPPCMLWKAFDGIRASNNHGVRFMMGHARQNTKSTYGREGLTSHFTRTTENRRMCKQSIFQSSSSSYELQHALHMRSIMHCFVWRCVRGYLNQFLRGRFVQGTQIPTRSLALHSLLYILL